ncbi:MAG TPA: hypothetical protein VK171_14265 [Fimbriimonas sp.]|nr:hypothetical protein [Fimbriimonas sp.]
MKRKKLRDKLFWTSVAFMVFLFLFAVFGPLIPNGQKDPVMDVIGMPHQPYGSPHALLGTDEIGRSFLQRIAAGARISLTIGFTVQLINLTVGLFIGAVSTFGPKWVTNPLQRFTDAMFAFPDILLAILIISIMGRGNTRHITQFSYKI